MSSALAIRGGGTTVHTDKLKQLLQLLSPGELGAIIDDISVKQAPGSLGKIALGADANTQMALRRGLGKTLSAIPGVEKAGAMRMAMSPAAKTALRFVPGLTFLGAGLGVADVVAGGDSLANKGMDIGAMGIGGALGSVGGPVGIAAGMALGKGASDLTQFLLGGGESAEDRKMREALALLQGGRLA